MCMSSYFSDAAAARRAYTVSIRQHTSAYVSIRHAAAARRAYTVAAHIHMRMPHTYICACPTHTYAHAPHRRAYTVAADIHMRMPHTYAYV
jgi:hypothetical protein